MTRAASSTEEITDVYNKYNLSASVATNTNQFTENCTAGPLYRDQFSLVIHNFTYDKNGYYWCEIVVNGSVSQPPHYAWFYAADNSSCTQQYYFKKAPIPHCAEFISNNYSTSMIYPTAMDNVVTSATTPSTAPSTTTSTKAGNEPLYYVAGFLSLFSLLLISLVVLLLFLYCCKQRRKPHPQKKGTFSDGNLAILHPQVHYPTGSSGLMDGHSDNQ